MPCTGPPRLAKTSPTGVQIIVFQNTYFFLKKLLHTVPCDKDVGDRHLKLYRDFCAPPVLNRREMERLPRRWLQSLFDAAHRELEQLMVESVFELLFQVSERVV